MQTKPFKEGKIVEINAFEENISLELQFLDMLKQEGEWRSTTFIANYLEINIKKASTLLNNLTHKIKKFNSKQLTLKTVKGRGNLLVVKNNQEYIKFRRSIIEDTITYKIIFSIVLNKNSNIVNLALENFVSESLIRNQITKINVFLKNWDVKIVTRKKNCIFIGDEPQIRVMIQTLFWRLYRGEEWPFPHINQTIIKDIIHEFSESLNLNIQEVTCCKIAYVFAINYSRFRIGKVIGASDCIKKYNRLCYWIDSKTKIYNILKFKYKLVKDEIDFFILELITQKDIYNKMVENMDSSASLLKDTPAYVATQLLLKKYNNYFEQLTTKQSVIFYKNIFPCHLYADLFSNLIFSESGYFGLNLISQYTPELKKTIEEMINSLYLESKLKIFSSDKYLLTDYILTFSEFFPIIGKEKNIIILVETDTSEVAEQFLINSLKTRFLNLYNLKFITKAEDIKDDIDIIISTNALRTNKNLKNNIQNFIIHLFPTQRELNDIENYLKLLSGKNIK